MASRTPERRAAGIVVATDRRIPSLDGIRAVAILLVLWAHVSGGRGYPAWANIWTANPHYHLGILGVRIFFVLSGFLITGLLLEERARHGRVSLRQFYLRRTLRIVPAYAAYLSVVLVLAWAGLVSLTRTDVAHALTYTTNYDPARSRVVTHLWSLSVEEQFYLLWPAVVAVLALRRAARVAVGVVLVVPLVRLAAVTWFPGSAQAGGGPFEVTADALAIGCLLALWRDELWASRVYRALLLARWPIPLLFAVGMLCGLSTKLGLLVGETCVLVAIGLAIDRSVRRPTGLAGRVLNARPMVAIGVASYSLYLWQQLVLDASPTATFAFPINLAMAGALAWGSYRYIEQPALRWRQRLTARRTRHLVSAAPVVLGA
jgi:peptidoglycan/LPS O-acetylase OafA/YrhL